MDFSLTRKWAVLGETELGDHVQEEWALKKLMSGIARTAVGLVEDGLEAWRQLHVQFEPELMVQQEQVSRLPRW